MKKTNYNQSVNDKYSTENNLDFNDLLEAQTKTNLDFDDLLKAETENLDFDDLLEAEMFLRFKNSTYRKDKFFIKENEKYANIKGRVNQNINKYINVLQFTINGLEYKIDLIEGNKEFFSVQLNSYKGGKCHNAPLNIIKSIVDNGPEKMNRTFYQSNDEIKICSNDYSAYVKKYNYILKELDKYKKLVAKYKKQLKLFEQKNSTKEDQNENIL